MVRIRRVKPLRGFRLELELTNGVLVERDVGPLLKGPVFQRLRTDPALFLRVRVEGGTVVWPGGLDLCPDTVIWGGLPPADESAMHLGEARA